MTTSPPEDSTPLEQLDEALHAAVDHAATVAEQHRELARAFAESETALARTAEQLAAAQDEIRRLREQLPATPRAVLGACPAKPVVGFNAKAAQGVVDRFGPGAGVRLFGGTLATKAPRPAAAGHVHVSYDYGDDITRRQTPELLVGAATNLRPGDAWERQHESDAKVRRGKYTLAQAQAALSDFARNAKAARPDLLTTITFTGWLFSPNKTAPGLEARNAWGETASRFDVVGIDLDAVHGWPYPDYRGKHIDNLLRFLDAFGIERFAVPELGWSRQPQHDPTGQARVELLEATVERLEETGRCAWIDAYLYESTVGNDFNQLEAQAWGELVAARR